MNNKDTGVVNENMILEDALHQMLELKHGAELTPISITTNFMNNV